MTDTPPPAPAPCDHPGPALEPTYEDGVRTGLRCSSCGERWGRPRPPVILDPADHQEDPR